MKKNEHDHKGTTKLKVIIFSIVMMLPLITSLTSVLYYSFNNNAELQTYEKQEPIYYESNEVNTISDLKVGNIYKYTDNWNTELTTQNDTQLIVFTTPNNQLGFNNYENIKNYYLYVTNTGTAGCVARYKNNTTEYKTITNTNFSFIVEQTDNPQNPNWTQLLTKIEKENYNYIKDYQTITYTNGITQTTQNAINETFNNNLFNWTNQSPINTPIQTFTNIFGITNDNVINNYLVYWCSMVAIYIVFDIIIELFTYLTHLFSNEKE